MREHLVGFYGWEPVVCTWKSLHVFITIMIVSILWTYLLKYVLWWWIIPWRSEAPHMRQSKDPYILLLSTFCWLSYLHVGIDHHRERGCIFNPFCQSKEIYLSRSNERRQGDRKYGQESATLNKTVMSGGSSDKRGKIRAASLSRGGQQCLQVMYDDTGRRVLLS